ncbi:hypothetical protein D3C86_1229180 [compost metagenome]
MHAHAQKSANRLEIEIDPIAYILRGYSFHAGYNVGNIRFDAGFFAIKQPSFFISDERFSIYTRGAGLKADYFFKQNRGLFFGLQSDYVIDRITLNETGQKLPVDYFTAGLRTGYRFSFGKEENQHRGFYVVPWVAFIYSVNAPKAVFESAVFESTSWSIFPTVHVGWRF